jgi:hypothetical protein
MVCNSGTQQNALTGEEESQTQWETEYMFVCEMHHNLMKLLAAPVPEQKD